MLIFYTNLVGSIYATSLRDSPDAHFTPYPLSFHVWLSLRAQSSADHEVWAPVRSKLDII